MSKINKIDFWDDFAKILYTSHDEPKVIFELCLSSYSTLKDKKDFTIYVLEELLKPNLDNHMFGLYENDEPIPDQYGNVDIYKHRMFLENKGKKLEKLRAEIIEQTKRLSDSVIENKQSENDIKNLPIYIPYDDDKKNKMIELLYNSLINNYIPEIAFIEFKKHFEDSNYKKIVWLQHEAELKALIDGLIKDLKFNLGGSPNIVATTHFLNKKNKPLKPKQFGSIANMSGVYNEINTNTKSTHPLRILLTKLQEIQILKS